MDIKDCKKLFWLIETFRIENKIDIPDILGHLTFILTTIFAKSKIPSEEIESLFDLMREQYKEIRDDQKETCN